MTEKTERNTDEYQTKLAEVLVLVQSAMHKQDTATHFGDTNGMDLVAQATAEKIMRVFA